MKKHLSMKPIFKLGLLLLSISLSFSPGIIGQPANQTFNASGTYTIPSGYSANLTIEAWGAGGGGGSNTGGPKGGGGSGAYASLTTTLSAGSYTVTVGAGGGPGVNGGNSSFTTIVVAAGGSSTNNATGGAGGTTAASTGSVLVAGANGANTIGNTGGNGAKGANGGGNGGPGGPANNGNGTAGNAPGGGGGGKAGPGAGGISGSGANGRVVVTVNIVLPVKLSSVKASEQQNGVLLEWTAYEEQNIVKYIIERSETGSSFIPVGNVPALNSGNTTNYRFFDSNPVSGLNLYRLRIIDQDGKSSFSNIIRINLDKSNKEMTIYPNPVKRGSTVSFNLSSVGKGGYTARIFNNAGQEVLRKNYYSNGGAVNQAVPLPANLKPGIYFIQLDNEEGAVSRKRFLVD